LAGNQVWWTWEVEDVFRKVKKGDKMAMKNYSKRCHSQIDELVVKVRSNLSKNDRKKFNTVLIIEVHARDIVDGYVRDRLVVLTYLKYNQYGGHDVTCTVYVHQYGGTCKQSLFTICCAK
jgi:hypothetical protein